MTGETTAQNTNHTSPQQQEKVAPSAHFSEVDNIEYEYETPPSPEDSHHHHHHHHDDDDQQRQQQAARRRASHRMSRRESISGGAAPFDVSYHPGALILYCPPKQRQRWGDSQVLPRVDFGDLFFDLFFVAAAYNVRTAYCLQNLLEWLYCVGWFDNICPFPLFYG